MQREFLLGTDGADAWDIRCMSLYHESDNFLGSHKSLLTGRMMDQWWDKCQEAGASARAVEPFAEDLPTLECLTVSENEVKIRGSSASNPKVVRVQNHTTYIELTNYLYKFIHIRSYQIISALVNKTHVFRLEKTQCIWKSFVSGFQRWW